MTNLEASESSTVTLPSALTLPRLPLEVQLCVLRECLISQHPLLNFHLKDNEVYFTVKDEPRGQDDISFGILSTCKLYYQEGRKILYANNDFVYTSTLQTRRGLLSPASPSWKLCPQQLISSTIFDGSLPHFTALKHLTLRLIAYTNSLASLAALNMCKHWLAQASQLVTLQLDLVSQPDGHPRNFAYERHSMRLIYNDNWFNILQVLREKFSNWRSDNGGLTQIVITGLGDNFAGFLVVKTISYLLAEQGWLGLGTGKDGRRYEYVGKLGGLGMMDFEVYALPEPSLIWLTNKDREIWIKTKGEELDPGGVSDKIY